MARRVVVTVVDDLDASVEATATVEFGVDGRSYEIDLGALNEARFRALLAPYLAAARKVSGKSRPARGKAAEPRRLGEVRAWARLHGHSVNSRGRVSQEIIDAYESAHPA